MKKQKEQTSNDSQQIEKTENGAIPSYAKANSSSQMFSDAIEGNKPAGTHNPIADKEIIEKVLKELPDKTANTYKTLWGKTTIKKLISKALKLKEQDIMNRLVKQNVKEACHTLAKDDKALTEIANKYLEVDKIIEQAKQEHCKDCCCAKSWEALGIKDYTGKSIPEEITKLKDKAYEEGYEDGHERGYEDAGER